MMIQQALFGYQEGHHLLASSIRLDRAETQLMERLSDGPGQEMPTEFDGYLTGYSLPSSPYYVIGKTWGANELERPGCVWTHVLLIPKDVTSAWQDGGVTEFNFSRPDQSRQNWLEPYRRPLSLQCVPENGEIQRTAYGILSLMLEDDTVLVLSDNPSSFHDALLFLLFHDGALLWEDFSFCTFSRICRKIPAKGPFHLQIAPRSMKSITSRQFAGHLVVDASELEKGVEPVKENPDTLQFVLSFIMGKKLHTISLKAIRKIRNIFSEADKLGAQLFKAISEIKTLFPDSPKEQEAVFSEFVLHLLDISSQNGETGISNMLELCATDQMDFSVADSTLSEMVERIYQFGDQWVCGLINELFYRKMLNSFGERLLRTICLRMTDSGTGVFLKKYPDKTASLISMNPKLALLDCVWQQPTNVQSDALNAIRDWRNRRWKDSYPLTCHDEDTMLEKLYENSKGDFASTLIQMFHGQGVSAFFHWAENKTAESEIRHWASICGYDNSAAVIARLCDSTNPVVFRVVINVINPRSPALRTVKPGIWEHLYRRFCQGGDKASRETYAVFLLPMILSGGGARNLAEFTLCEVHDIYLVNDKRNPPIVPWTKWEQISPLLPLPESEQKAWDKCSRIRRAAKDRFGVIIPEPVG